MINLLKFKDAKEYYESLGDDLVKGKNEEFKNREKPLWFNVGYWKDTETFEDACKNYADNLFNFGNLKDNCDILDVGFGFGVQDIHWAKKHNIKSIKGINISPTQVRVARELVEDAGLSNVIDLREGDAISLDFDDESFDAVIALDCAYHFTTRKDFIKEAYRVLRPGGKLVFTDMMPIKEKNSRFGNFLLKLNAIPKENFYPKEHLFSFAESVNFEDMRYEDISQWVFQGAAKFGEQRMKGKRVEDIKVKLNPKDEKKYRRPYNLSGIKRCYMFSMTKKH
ncbi:methyltransferase domain-containing protein [Aquimarina sp. BL5]|uniref:class I SAM-dependent methyltransferase n=1 Tax=Aquimarina sp. BL5 TaxID=1714860 RepID=UPI000E555C20|nr:class I SAM-dependent methyltransferase [Aquimarina sp. BL5]AXT51943.1 methyltransferase domain-containing protein [Aquimarina sp. BL5]RKN02900.1 methyltransferase domain-containing protein [Aquimarina sp. BL5]